MSTDLTELNAPDHFSRGYETHEVLNQPGFLADYDAYSDDKPLLNAVNAFGGSWAEQTLRRAGLEVGSAKVQQLARQANRNLPELRTHDRFGNRIDVVEYHPAYHELMRLIYETQAHSFAWTHKNEPGAHVVRAALSYMWNQGENGICCPMGMTFASIPALQHDQGLYDEWVPQILRAGYDDRPIYAKSLSRWILSLFREPSSNQPVAIKLARTSLKVRRNAGPCAVARNSLHDAY